MDQHLITLFYLHNTSYFQYITWHYVMLHNICHYITLYYILLHYITTIISFILTAHYIILPACLRFRPWHQQERHTYVIRPFTKQAYNSSLLLLLCHKWDSLRRLLYYLTDLLYCVVLLLIKSCIVFDICVFRYFFLMVYMHQLYNWMWEVTSYVIAQPIIPLPHPVWSQSCVLSFRMTSCFAELL